MDYQSAKLIHMHLASFAALMYLLSAPCYRFVNKAKLVNCFSLVFFLSLAVFFVSAINMLVQLGVWPGQLCWLNIKLGALLVVLACSVALFWLRHKSKYLFTFYGIGIAAFLLANHFANLKTCP
ncbi:hypothetical protein [Agaribacterium haliotis]|uniref:hypothetical protein n=1 Tax=Agaribacterium haliotis TaxID=2013869 RepID=UPI000BB57224|nr:hypothetical protein [Agaribacterium haliotis]